MNTKSQNILYLIVLLIVSACSNDDVVKKEWQLVWADDFESNGAPEPDRWTYDLGDGGWGNQELQSYTQDSNNVTVKDGKLMITAIRSGDFFTSARIKTQGLMEQAYGRFEASIKLPYGPGIWPAFWLLGNDIEQNPWPICGEIDIMEYRGQEPNIIHGSVHGPGYSGGNAITKSYALQNDRFDTDYHLYAIEWGEDYIYYYVDEVLYQVITPDDVTGEWVYDHEMFIILNIAVGGTFVGFPVDNTPFPQTMYVDWVRVYKAM